MRIRRLNHSVYQLEYHLVWGTKFRRKFLKHYVRKELINKFYKVLRKHPDWYMHKINTGDDHVHLLLEIPPKYQLSKVVCELKSTTSIYLKKQFKFINSMYPKDNIWSTGYFISSVGLNEKQIKKYIEKQNQYDLGLDITDEFS